ncbi:uncharacterized protein LOC123909756 [Trifolium pratense]|uniref:uncharacterized protein LOC123909756 n=1 Tax=Trifolium pratense TaxID=57577 RepID=UPI001E69461D|nr:uncharacterized protein LOC123909756 [Trifolium pratense]
MTRVHMEEEGRAEQICLPPQPSPYPWLLYFNDSEEGENKNQTFRSILDPTITYSTSIPELMGAAVKVWTIQHGWCLLENLVISYSITDHHRNLFLWSPSNFKKIELPHLKLSNNITIGYCIFSSSPTATDQVCSIFLFAINTTIIFYCQLGDEQWTEVDCHDDLLVDPALKNGTSFTNPVHCNGSLYATLWGTTNTVLVEIQKHELRCLQIKSTGVSLPKCLTSFPEYGLHQITHWFGSNHQLFRIIILLNLDKVIRVVVHKYDFSLRMWEKVESIKDKVFFISVSDPKSNYVGSSSHFVCQAINSETEGGRIYFALKDNNFVYIYNIEDNSLMISPNFSNLPKSRSCWLWYMPEPTCVRSTDILKKEVISEYGGAIHLRETEDRATHFDSSTLPLDLVEAIVKCLNVHFDSYTLPLDVVKAIAKGLNVFDYLHLRAINRHFRREAPPLVEIEWRSRFDDLSTIPLFVLSYKDNVFTFVHPKQGLKYKYTINFPPQPQVNTDDEIICYSKDGWLLLALRHSSFFFNPFTKQVIPLAHGSNATVFTHCVGFSHPPTSSKCATVECMGILSFLTFLGGERIPSIYEGDDFDKFPLYDRSPVFFNGSFYYLSVEGKLGVIQVRQHAGNGIGLIWKELEEPQAPLTNYFNSFLVECDGNLLSVFEVEGQFQNWVHVFKLNEPTMTWIKVESLENHMLFVCSSASFSTAATIPGMENKIYFPRLYGQNIVFYSLETNNYHTFENEVLNFNHVREQLNSSWIQPRCH